MNNNEHNEFDSLEKIFKESEEELKKNPKNIKALFNLTLLKVPFIKQNPEEILKDLLYLYKKLSSKRDILANYIAQCYAELNDFDKGYEYAKEALKLPEQLRFEGYFTLIQMCMFKGNEYFDEALDYLDEALQLDLEEEIKLHFYSLKLELFIRKQDKEAFDKALNEIYLIFGNKIEVLYEKINGMLSFNVSKEEKITYIDELKYLVEQYPDDFFINIGYINIYKQLEMFDQALVALDNFDKVNNKYHDQIVKEKLDIYVYLDEENKAIELLTEYKESAENKFYANILFFTYYSQNENLIFKALPYIEEIYEENSNNDIFESLCRTLILLDERKKLAEYSYKHLEKDPNNQRANFYVGQNGCLIGLSYDEVVGYFNKSRVGYNFFSLIEMIYHSKDPKPFIKLFNKEIKKAFKSNNPRILILLAEILLKGEFTKPKPKLAKKLIEKASYILHNPTDVKDGFVEIQDYTTGLMGRYYELYENDLKAAGDFYEKGAESFFDQPRDYLILGSYYIHKYLKGIGTNVDIEKAVRKLKDFDEEYKYTKSNLICFEAYLSMLGKYDKDVNLILENLENDYYFARYDLNRYMLLKQFTKHYNLESDKLKELDFNNSLKYASYKELEYYKKHKDDKIYYPFI